MRTAKQKNKKTTVLATAILALAVLGAAGLIYAYNIHAFGWGQKADIATTYTAPTAEQSAAGMDTKANTTSDTGKASTSGSDQPPAPTPSETGKRVVEVSIPTQNQDSQYYRIRFQISASVTTGTCTLTLSKAGSTSVIKSSPPFQSGSQISTCQGFDILKSELTPGDWTTDLIFENADLYGHVAGSVTIQ